MANKKQIKASELKGLNIFQDPKHGTILYDWISSKGYQLTSSDVKWFELSRAFLPIAVVIAYASNSLFSINMSKSIIIALIAYIVMRMIYRFRFLNKLPYVEGYSRPNNGNIFTNAANNYSKTRLIILLVLAIALVIVSALYLLLNKPQGDDKITFYILIIASLVLLLFSIITLLKKNNNH